MTQEDVPAVAEALRSAREPAVREHEEPEGVLRDDCRRVLFAIAAIAPIDALMWRSLDGIAAAEENAPMEDEGLVDLWRSTVRANAMRYGASPQDWLDHDSEEFHERCTYCFGLDGSRIPSLVRAFHSMPMDARYGVLHFVARTPLFGHLVAEFEGHRTEFADPDHSFRALIRAAMEGA